MAKIGLISCVKTKLSVPAPAAELYTSNLFKKSRHYASTRLDRYYILSAEYGLLEPDEVISPYEKTLTTMPTSERKAWSEGVIRKLSERTSPGDQFVFLAGSKYREFVERELRGAGYATASPLEDLDMFKQPGWYKEFSQGAEYISHLDRFYRSLKRLEQALGGIPTLGELTSAMLPERGVYFFFEPGEFRRTEPFERRVTRVGTHCVSKGSKATLWSRLSAHRGAANFDGNHRSSIFRLHVGSSLILMQVNNDFPQWGIGQNQPPEVRGAELPMEQAVSARLRDMGVLWLDVNDESGPLSHRAYIERNSVALLSTSHRKIDTASKRWLGRHCANPAVADSSLWNVRHVVEDYDPRFLNMIDDYVDLT